MLVVMDRQFDAALDTGVAIIEEALDRGVFVDVCDTEDLQFTADGVAADAARVVAAAIEGMDLAPATQTLLAHYDVILYRKLIFTIEALHATLLLEHARGHAVMVNDPRGLREANDKLFALRFPSFTPATAVLRDPAAITAFCDAQNGECVIKPLDEAGGSGVFLLRDGDPNLSAIIDVATQAGSRRVIAQASLPVTEQGDKRIFLIDGEPIGALLRMPAADDFRANMRRDASPHETTLTSRERTIARAVGAACRDLGLAFVGIDVIADHLTEINVTGATGFRQLEQLTGQRLQENVVDYLLHER